MCFDSWQVDVFEGMETKKEMNFSDDGAPLIQINSIILDLISADCNSV